MTHIYSGEHHRHLLLPIRSHKLLTQLSNRQQLTMLQKHQQLIYRLNQQQLSNNSVMFNTATPPTAISINMHNDLTWFTNNNSNNIYISNSNFNSLLTNGHMERGRL